jgi:DNA-binding MarR family transcriptional regulator
MIKSVSAIPVVAMQDDRLTFKAKGVLCTILAVYGGERPSVRELAKQSCEGEKATAVALRDLEERGYIEPSKYRRRKG